MGAEGSKEKRKRTPSFLEKYGSKKLDERLTKAFHHFGKGSQYLNIHHFTKSFGEDFGADLWKFLTNDGSEKEEMDVHQFAERAFHLIGPQTDYYLKLLAPSEHILKICAEAAGFDLHTGDEKFHENISASMKVAEDSNSLEMWKRDNCPRMFETVQHQLMEKFGLSSMKPRKQGSDVLSEFEMWFVMSSLPDLYFPTKSENGSIIPDNWTKLYSSMEHGISVTRFRMNVFDYRGPTVGIFRLKDNSLFVLAREDEWKDSSKPYTSTSTVLMRLLPDYIRIERPSIFCNFKLRNSPVKLSFDRYGTIDKDMDNLVGVEVFGCSNSSVFNEQQKQKQRQERLIEINQKVPLPGNWDDNPDKFLLELGGGYSTENQREVFHRDENGKW